MLRESYIERYNEIPTLPACLRGIENKLWEVGKVLLVIRNRPVQWW
ncbi:hypothetical protein [Candidatus Methanoperedens nitratireducens]|uniref:Uncharacterized protein n=1 Tax=Candidatus Methanoperedens nitratireducens TaxID=1392998 RepID=A0A284VQS0_9EURY|nr:hypothetical protein [Candidatus Methanoperedens nitroreducens]SNQ61625.1 hypothetical protein MNV_420009 [Candidatus Methanoperedens nitroreducens]